jgi:hypothetical protein
VRFAEGTTVTVEKSRAEIESVVRKYGATEFTSGWTGEQAGLEFKANGRRVRFVLTMPDQAWAKALLMKSKRPVYYNANFIPAAAIAKVVDAEHRRRWRCLLLTIKAKLEFVESGIATFEEEFLAHLVVDNKTIYDHIRFAQGNGRPLLPPLGE